MFCNSNSFNHVADVCVSQGALLHLDFLSIKAGAPQWLLEIWEAYGKMNEDQLIGRLNVRALPGWAYARALALFIAEETKIEKASRFTYALTRH